MSLLLLFQNNQFSSGISNDNLPLLLTRQLVKSELFRPDYLLDRFLIESFAATPKYILTRINTLKLPESNNMKQGDTDPPYRAYLSEILNGEVVPVDVSDYTATFIMFDAFSGVEKVNADAVIEDGPAGIVRYDWADSDTDTIGKYKIVLRLTSGFGKIRSFPSDGFDILSIEPVP